MRRRKRPVQLTLRPRTWGGARKGAGRKPAAGRRSTPHRARPPHNPAHPVHLTLRARAGLPSLRRRSVYRVLLGCLSLGSRQGFRVIQFSVQHDHLHRLVEAQNAVSLSSGARGLAVRTARRLNSHLGRKGNVWAVRYHTRALKTPTEVRHALVYVLMNIKKHSRDACDGLDPCSSAPWFDGFVMPQPHRSDHPPPPIPPPRTWLAAHGWRRRGLIHPGESPRGRA